MYAICLSNSDTISGAEKRAIKLFSELNRIGIPCKLIISKQLFYLFKKGEYREYLNDHCILINTRWLRWLTSVQFKNKFIKVFFSVLRYTDMDKIIERIYCNQLNKIILKNNLSVLHVFLDLQLTQFIQKDINHCKIIFEITSPDYVKRLSNKNLFLDNIDKFNAVSDSVYYSSLKFIDEVKLSKAPIPFFNPIEYSIDDNDNIFEKKENVIIFAHRLINRKNGLLFAQVVKVFLQKKPDWLVKIYGKGPESERINNILQEEIREGKVMTGYTTKIIPELMNSKIFVSLIEPDNYPSQSVLEAMYTGNALLLSDKGYTGEKFINNNGLLSEITFDDVLNNLMNLVETTNLEILGQNSMTLLNDRYNKKIYVDYILNLYKSVTEY